MSLSSSWLIFKCHYKSDGFMCYIPQGFPSWEALWFRPIYILAVTEPVFEMSIQVHILCFVEWQLHLCFVAWLTVMSPKTWAFSVHQSQIKNTETKFGGNRKVAFNHQPTEGRLCPPPLPWGIGGYTDEGLESGVGDEEQTYKDLIFFFL